MPEPKKQPTKRRMRQRRSHMRLNLAKKVNRKSPVKVFTTTKQSSKPADSKKPEKPAKKTPAKKAAAKPVAKKTAAKKPTSKTKK